MKTSSRPREIGGSFASRRGHGAQLSISDTNHHVTEAIGDMYGDDDDYSKRDSRPLSFVSSPLHDSIDGAAPYPDSNQNSRSRPGPSPNGTPSMKSHTSPGMMQSPRSNSFDKGQLSPSLSLRDRNTTDTANAQFPLNDIDYESNPAAVAQELSNLQALRRMSMDVGNTSDPDLPSFQGVSLMPSVAPTGDDNEDDPSRLFWVPARVHPELAPMEFKTFLENRVQSIKRRSGDQTSLSPDGLDRSESGGSLRRKKSMLSRQINNDGGRGAVGYKDGAEQIERQKSLSSNQAPDLKIADLQELDALVRDPSKAMKKLSLDTGNRQGPNAERAGSLRGDTDGEESPLSSPIDGRPSIGFPLTKVQSEPTTTENFSRPNRGARRLQNLQQSDPNASSTDAKAAEGLGVRDANPVITESPSQPPQQIPPRNMTSPRNDTTPVPRIIETPPPENPTEAVTTQVKPSQKFPERSSSQTPPKSLQKQPVIEPPAKSNRRPGMDRQNSSNKIVLKSLAPSQTLNDMAQHPSPLPGDTSRTDTLTFIPTLEEKKPEKKSKKDKDDSEHSGSRKTSWGWFKGSDEREKKDKKKEKVDDQKESKRGKAKVSLDKTHDGARLDVLQSTLEPVVPRGRESLLLDRDSMDNKLQDERKKESSRKSGGENKKEKDGLFSSFFGGGKKKSDRNSGDKKDSSLRTLSPDPPHRELRPDVDYQWTRFTILEERAIYRMAHIKLANPRRALYSQVLLSNFMYSYLAKVQQMHPQMQVPQSAIQKKQEAERRQKEQEQQYREEQQRQQGEEQYRYDYHSGITNYAEPSQNTPPESGVNYVDDSQIYDYDHQGDGQSSNRPQSRASQHSNENGYGDQSQQYSRQGKEYYPYGNSESHGRREDDDDDDDMW
ncbi:Protein zds1 [Lachnellula suecica]|uniref:Protein zds1 n=1 Tax=Lachnellula suecica TaxID=602035 RepID=A0A8T9CD57_9HELO|nr:Protein zds1 [Lachnellula suecica]